MKRWGAFAVAVAAIVVGIASPARAAADGPCTGTSCGTPTCGSVKVRTRPAVTRRVTVSCSRAEAARVTSQPSGVSVSNVTADFYGLHFDVSAASGAPRWNSAVFEVDGPGGSIDLTVTIEVIPTSQNSAPVCYGDSASQRTDGKSTVELYMHPFCYDPDGDDFVMRGGPPGTHPESPKSVAAGSGESNWRYRTATTSGSERSPVWATDSLGARSPDAYLDVTIGPIDRLPECRPNPWSSGPYAPIYSRPGAIRRFAMICEDADGDLFEPLLTAPPTRGVLATVPGLPSYGFWGVERWIDATYTPFGNDTTVDRFAMSAVGARGTGPAGQMGIVPRALPANSGGSCGWSPAQVVAGAVGEARMTCGDDDGDPLSAEIVTAPQHGTAAPPVLTPWLYGLEQITIGYVADPDYEGYDCVKVKVSDGHGLVFNLVFDIWVKPPPPKPPPLPDPPVDPPDLPVDPPDLPVDPPAELPDPPADPPADPPEQPDQPAATDPEDPPNPPADTSQPTPGERLAPPAPPHIDAPLPELPLTGAAPPGTPAGAPPDQVGPADVRALAQEALGTNAIRRLHTGDGTEVWARSRLSRSELLKHGSAPGVVVVCLIDCQIRSDSAVTGLRSLKATRRKGAATKTAGQAHVVTIDLNKAERRALRRARRPRARFNLTVRPAGAKSRPLHRSIPIARVSR